MNENENKKQEQQINEEKSQDDTIPSNKATVRPTDVVNSRAKEQRLTQKPLFKRKRANLKLSKENNPKINTYFQLIHKEGTGGARGPVNSSKIRFNNPTLTKPKGQEDKTGPGDQLRDANSS